MLFDANVLVSLWARKLFWKLDVELRSQPFLILINSITYQYLATLGLPTELIKSALIFDHSFVRYSGRNLEFSISVGFTENQNYNSSF